MTDDRSLTVERLDDPRCCAGHQAGAALPGAQSSFGPPVAQQR
ncbi:hypothetical protein ACFCW6_15245 [Streptomyces sp. NPDC056333]